MSGPDQEHRYDAEWRERLALLGQEAPADPGAAARAVDALKRAGTLRKARRYNVLYRLFIGAAAALIIFLAGSWWGGGRGGQSAALPGQRFALFLLEDSTFQGTEQVGHDSLVAEYSAWAGNLARTGHLILGEELGASSWPLGTVGDSPAGRITGLFVLSADNSEAALVIARSCPHLRYGGGIIVRPIQPTS